MDMAVTLASHDERRKVESDGPPALRTPASQAVVQAYKICERRKSRGHAANRTATSTRRRVANYPPRSTFARTV